LTQSASRSTGSRFFVVGLGLLAVVAGVLVLWSLRSLVLLVFAAILVAVFLDAVGRGLRRLLPIGHAASVLIGVCLLLAVSVGIFTVLGAQMMSELSELSQKLPRAVNEFERWLKLGSLEDWITRNVQKAVDSSSMLWGLSGATALVFSVATGLLLIFVGGLFLALNPRGYRSGAVRLLPAHLRPKAEGLFTAIARALRAWLIGQLAAMVLVGVCTAAGLWLLGVSTSIALGVIAGLLEFIPYAGPVASAIPALAVAFVDSPTTAFWVGVLYLTIQQIEGTVLIPLIQRETVDLPPAATLFSIVGFGIVLGPVGILLAAPLTVFGIVVIRHLWVPWVDRIGSSGAKTPKPSEQ
jgi:predicted PurR-regulated permease PerM